MDDDEGHEAGTKEGEAAGDGPRTEVIAGYSTGEELDGEDSASDDEQLGSDNEDDEWLIDEWAEAHREQERVFANERSAFQARGKEAVERMQKGKAIKNRITPSAHEFDADGCTAVGGSSTRSGRSVRRPRQYLGFDM